ncbi:MAG: DHH family phosphoesterase [Bacteroidales bacterium]|nr:DHH family phosphoesterase [Bacteroidales bacterium]
MLKFTPEKINRLHQILSDASVISIVSHMNPDGDAFGSSLGMLHYLTEKMDKDACLTFADPDTESLAFMLSESDRNTFFIDKINSEKTRQRLAESDLIICLDFNAFSRAGSLEIPLKESISKKVLIDHHLNPDESAFDLVFSETQISSASELTFHILMAMPDIDGDASKIPSESAAALMTGMTTDTNNFANSVFPSTLFMASKLLEAGVDRDAIVANIYNNYRENRVRLMGHLLSEKLVITEEGMAYIVLDQKTADAFDLKDGETEGFVNIPLSIKNVRMSGFFREDGDHMRVSLRSKKGTSANVCAKQFFHGGGHENAAGGRIMFPEDVPSVNEVAEYIERICNEYLKQN